jgi:hypothetical protein
LVKSLSETLEEGTSSAVSERDNKDLYLNLIGE